MVLAYRPFRSMLYIPASRARAVDKARTLRTDAIIFDLEDAVSPTEKVAARTALKSALTAGGYGARFRIVRINGTDTQWWQDDAAMALHADCDAILVPKIGSPDDVARIAERTDGKPIWAMIETPDGILNSHAIAHAPGLSGFVLGTNDLANDIGARPGPDRIALLNSLQQALLAARSAGIPCIDGVYNAFKDQDGFLEECRQGRELGMDGKTLIHPDQIDIANEVFGLTPDDLELARRHILAFDEALAKGEGIAVVDGRIVEKLHVECARATLARAEAIEKLETA